MICIAAVSGGVVVLRSCRSYEIKSRNRTVAPYDDRIETSSPGNSEIFWVHEDSTSLRMSYVLREGFSYPYAGILVYFNDRTGDCLDCSRFDALKIRISSSQLSDCKIYLTVFDRKVSKRDVPLRERCLQKDLTLDPVSKTFLVPFARFKTPEWWFQKNNITLKDVAPVDFSKVTALKIESGSTAKIGTIDTITVSGLYLVNRPGAPAFALMVIPLIAGGICLFFRSAPRKKKDSVIITYDRKEVRSYRDMDAQRISDYLAKRSFEPEISIVMMGKSLGLTRKKIARIMNDEFGMSFRQYLTSIRIHEAKRLLLETDRLVLDIALEVGFNNISHFNRVFKASTHVSPLVFRKERLN